MSADQNRRGLWLLVLYLPTSCLVIGLLSNLLRLAVPMTGSQASIEVFWAYALRYPSDFSIVRWIAPALGWGILLLMLISVRTRKPVLTLAEIRVILLVLIVIFTLLAKIFMVVFVKTPSLPRELLYATTKNPVILLFLFVDIDLILVLLASYLRIFKPLKFRLV